MKPKLIFRLFPLLVLSVLISCKNSSNTGLSKNVTGKAGELVVVISDEAWEGNPGNTIRNTLAQPHLALPQDEPLFDLIKVPHEAFKSIFKTTRNIVQTRISPNVDSEGVTFKDNVWASPQAVVIIQAKSEDEFEKLFEENKSQIMSYFIKAEKDRLAMNYEKYFERGIYNVLNDDFGLTMKLAPGFQIGEQKKDFIWLRYETPEISQGIVIYTFPYVSDSAFTIDYQLKVRDSLLKANVPGPTEGSFMATERRVEQFYNFRKHNGNYASEMRGLWRLVNDFMGGPYISLAELDAANQRVVVAYGYVYAPSKDKRNLLRQIEAMLYSMKLNSQEENDKLNEQQIDIDIQPENV
ncbi:protein of unknown function [Mariniphaga anaerophila]|uniref:DUF4837 domain-containing protein n=1 Tax=Mariniphaga anaerophila TaxID=1484053 RepID=A0A1M5CC13_9BACT|nr:DUF4837 family protein [Mariniphaga anaerophila]SHF52265.1 protein of unknown function [Mariniphaga anaerophila]